MQKFKDYILDRHVDVFVWDSVSKGIYFYTLYMIWMTMSLIPLFVCFLLYMKTYSRSYIVRYTILSICISLSYSYHGYVAALVLPELIRCLLLLTPKIAKQPDFKDFIHNDHVQFVCRVIYRLVKTKFNMKEILNQYVSGQISREIVPIKYFDAIENIYLTDKSIFIPGFILLIPSTNNLPVVFADNYEIQTESFECPVCITRHEIGIQLPCTHKYCHDCFIKWYAKKDTCPLCRQTLQS